MKRLLGRYPGTTEPEWSRPAEAPALIPMLLVGSWDETSERDRSAIERISARPYSATAATAARWLRGPDSPLARSGSRWRLVSRDDSWFFLAKVVTQNDLHRFEEVAIEVLAEDDPTYELSAEARWEARLQRKAPKYSSAMRTGIAETLALLAARSEGLTDAHGIVGRVEHIVRRLLSGHESARWISLSDQLPLLAEAGPEAFLDAVERTLRGESADLAKLFDQVGLMEWPSNHHAGLLWALEGLAWNREFFPRVSLILAAVDDYSPAVKSGNSPSRSFMEIFMPWRPQTTAPVEERIKVLEKVIQTRPHAGWQLLSGLLLNKQPFSMDIHRPQWRDWALARSASTPATDYWKQASACARLLIEHTGDDIERWKALIQEFEHLPGPVQKEFLERLSSLASATLDGETRRAVSELIREKVSLHRKFAGTNWALTADMLEELERVERRFEPEDAVRRNAWLFKPRWQLSETPEAEAERLEKRCPEALRQVIQEGGWKDVLKLVELVDAPEEVGTALAELDVGQLEKKILPGLLLAAGEKAARCAGGYARRRFQREAWDWVNRVDMHRWSGENVARFLVFLPFERKTWEFAAERGELVNARYWKSALAFAQGQNARDVAYAVEMLLKYDQAPAAFVVLQMALHQKADVAPSLLMDALEAWLKSATPERTHKGIRYEIPLLFQELHRGLEQNDPNVELHRLGRLEWEYLGLLDGHPASPVTLHGKLRDEPNFFVDVLGLVFRPKNEAGNTGKEIPEAETQRAQNAYRLLRSWRQVPGGRAGHSIDEKALFRWVHAARALARDRGLLEVCDSQIGEVCAYAPEESDGTWPCVPVRDVLEEIGTEDVIGGFSAGIYNKRAVFTKSMREGGTQERALAGQYRGFADACKIEWPQTAAALRRVAQAYEEDARREDSQAMLDQ